MVNIKNILFYMVITLSILSACESTLSNGIIELDGVTDEVREYVDTDSELQMLNIDENTAYIIVQISGDISANLETNGDTLFVQFEVEDQPGDEISQHIYALTTDADVEAIEVYMNGELKPFDNVTGI